MTQALGSVPCTGECMGAIPWLFAEWFCLRAASTSLRGVWGCALVCVQGVESFTGRGLTA